MNGLSYDSIAADWWPYLFILLAGWLPTDVWRWLGVLSAGRFDETSPAIALARTIATSLVAAVIGRLILFPTGISRIFRPRCESGQSRVASSPI